MNALHAPHAGSLTPARIIDALSVGTRCQLKISERLAGSRTRSVARYLRIHAAASACMPELGKGGQTITGLPHSESGNHRPARWAQES